MTHPLVESAHGDSNGRVVAYDCNKCSRTMFLSASADSHESFRTEGSGVLMALSQLHTCLAASDATDPLQLADPKTGKRVIFCGCRKSIGVWLDTRPSWILAKKVHDRELCVPRSYL